MKRIQCCVVKNSVLVAHSKFEYFFAWAAPSTGPSTAYSGCIAHCSCAALYLRPTAFHRLLVVFITFISSIHTRVLFNCSVYCYISILYIQIYKYTVPLKNPTLRFLVIDPFVGSFSYRPQRPDLATQASGS